MPQIKITDMNDSTHEKRYKGSGNNYAVTNIASLPTDFTNDFTAVATLSGATSYTEDIDHGYALHVSYQVLCTAISGGTTTVKVQRSNIGGSSADVWEDITGATVAITATGSSFIDLPNESIKLAKFLRIVTAAAGGNFTGYLIGYSITN